MEKHVVSINNLIEWTLTKKVEFASNHGRGNNKKLYVTLSGGYEVWNQGERILETMSPTAAINKYNEL